MADRVKLRWVGLPKGWCSVCKGTGRTDPNTTEDKMVTTVDATPEFDTSIECPDCKPSNYIIEGYGVIGGGIGPYTMCGNCGLLLSKSQDNSCESHGETVELKDASKDQATPDVQDRGTDKHE